MTTCRHCLDAVVLDPSDAEPCDSEWNDAPEQGQWCHVSSGGIYCDNDFGTRAEPDLRINAQLEEES